MDVVFQSENQHQQHYLQQQKQEEEVMVMVNQIQLQHLDHEEGDSKTAGSSSRKADDDEMIKHFHVLAVDDSQIDRKILEQLLTVSSYHVTSVDSGDKALKLLGLSCDATPPNSSSSSSAAASKSTPPSQENGGIMKVNLIMTDYSMPGMTGYDLLKRVKGSSSWKDIPVVVMSSENVPSRIHMCLEEGAEEFLLKPVRRSDLEKLQPKISKSKSNTKSIMNKQEICCCYINKVGITDSSSMEEETNSVDAVPAATTDQAPDHQLSSSEMLINPPTAKAPVLNFEGLVSNCVVVKLPIDDLCFESNS